MKAISLTANDWGKGRPRPIYPDGLSIMVYADSAIGRDVQPLFIPDIAEQWECRVCVAVRIGRLGKCIAERFADRYVDAIGLVAVIEPVAPDKEKLETSGVLSIMDSAVTTGQWCIAPGLPAGQLTMSVGDQSHSYEMSDLHIPSTISWVSRASTLKTGDILILRDTALSLPLVTNTWIHASLAGAINLSEALRIKVK